MCIRDRLMEVAYQCRRRGLCLRANWVPRLENQEADDLTNLEFKSFDPAHRLEVDLGALKFGVLNELFKEGDEYTAELEVLKAQAKAGAGERNVRKKKLAGDSLKDTQPW